MDALVGFESDGTGASLKFVFGTGVGPSSIRLGKLPEKREALVLPSDIPRIVGAISESLQLLGLAEDEGVIDCYGNF